MDIKLSIVTTLYRSSDYIYEFYQRVVIQCEKLTDNFEIIFVNDGSDDDSLEKCHSIFQNDSRVKLIDLSRNFGHHKAMLEGLSHAQGELVFLIDSDLEEPPELLEDFYQILQQNADIDYVYGIQAKRKGSLFERSSGHLYYKLVNALSEHQIPQNFLTVRLMRRCFVEALCTQQEREPIFANLVVLTGFKGLPSVVEKRHKGQSSYSFAKKLNLLVHTVTSSSAKPLWFIFFLGLLITLLSVIAVCFVFINKVLYDIAVEGWTSLMISIWFLGGILTLSTGILGLYISQIYTEAKQRPRVITRQLYQHTHSNKQEQRK